MYRGDLCALLVRLRGAGFSRRYQEALIAKSFSTWSRQNHRTFVAACERHGRKNREAIYAEVAEIADKDVASVKRYYKTFFERYQELSDWRRLMERIEKGEQKIKVRH